jgi:hypothetical protein
MDTDSKSPDSKKDAPRRSMQVIVMLLLSFLMHRGAGAPVGSSPAKNPKQAQGSRPLSVAKQEIKVRVLAVPPFSSITKKDNYE